MEIGGAARLARIAPRYQRHAIHTQRGTEAIVDWLVATGALHVVDQGL